MGKCPELSWGEKSAVVGLLSHLGVGAGAARRVDRTPLVQHALVTRSRYAGL